MIYNASVNSGAAGVISGKTNSLADVTDAVVDDVEVGDSVLDSVSTLSAFRKQNI